LFTWCRTGFSQTLLQKTDTNAVSDNSNWQEQTWNRTVFAAPAEFYLPYVPIKAKAIDIHKSVRPSLRVHGIITWGNCGHFYNHEHLQHSVCPRWIFVKCYKVQSQFDKDTATLEKYNFHDLQYIKYKCMGISEGTAVIV